MSMIFGVPYMKSSLYDSDVVEVKNAARKREQSEMKKSLEDTSRNGLDISVSEARLEFMQHQGLTRAAESC